MYQTLDGKSVFKRVWADGLKNIIFYGAGLLVVLWVSRYIPWITFLALAVFAVFLVIDVVRLFIAVGLGAAKIALMLRYHAAGGSATDELFRWGAIIGQVVETSVFVFYTAVLYVSSQQ